MGHPILPFLDGIWLLEFVGTIRGNPNLAVIRFNFGLEFWVREFDVGLEEEAYPLVDLRGFWDVVSSSLFRFSV